MLVLRTENGADHDSVNALITKAFVGAQHSDGTEAAMVSRLRGSSQFVAELSIVAELDKRLVGHILFSPITIRNENASIVSLALAPVSVHPKFQKQGIGGALIEEGHKRALSLGYKSSIVLGHASYYPRFGYAPASKWSIRASFPVPDQCFMARELVESSLSLARGVVEYTPEFGISS